MPITITEQGELYSPTGKLLKTLSCPRKVQDEDLKRSANKLLTCAACNRNVVDTDYMLEDELIELLEVEPDTCFRINLANPLFQTG